MEERDLLNVPRRRSTCSRTIRQNERRRADVRLAMEEYTDLPPEAIETYLESYKNEGKFTPYVFTSWNVEGGSS